MSDAQPPGWYSDANGVTRWWDGQQWGIEASSAHSPAIAGTVVGSLADERSLASLVQVLGLLTGFIGPLIVYITARPDQPFVKHHAAEALNFQITVTLAALVSLMLMFVLIGFLLAPVVVIGAFVLEIMAAVAANRGEWYRYPINLRLVSGAQG